MVSDVGSEGFMMEAHDGCLVTAVGIDEVWFKCGEDVTVVMRVRATDDSLELGWGFSCWRVSVEELMWV
ncbi:hypothetical protein V6N13_122388 [Hibiscus sabdariffa]